MSTDDVMQQNPDGSWVPAVPLGWQGTGIDFEVTTKRWDRDKRKMVTSRPYRWDAYDEDVLVGKGTARTKLGLYVAMVRCKRRFSPGGG